MLNYLLDLMHDLFSSPYFLLVFGYVIIIFSLRFFRIFFTSFGDRYFYSRSFTVNPIEVDAEEVEVSSESISALPEPKSSYKVDLIKKPLTAKQKEKLIFHNDGRVTLCSKKLLRF